MTASAFRRDEVDQLLEDGLLCQQAGQAAQAAFKFRQALAQQPEQPQALHLLGVLAHEAHHYEEAVRLITRALRRNKRDPVMWNNHGLALTALERVREAKTSFRRAIELRADYASPHLNLGNLHHAAGEREKATACLRRALGADPNLVGAHYNLGVVLDEQGRLEQAMDSYRAALAIAPDFVEARLNLANALRELERVDEAVISLQEVVRTRPEQVEAWIMLGNVHMAQQRIAAARQCYEQALKLRPEYGAVYNNLGSVFKHEGDFTAAERAVERALALQPDYADAHLSRALLLLARGAFAEAWHEYEWRFMAFGRKSYTADPRAAGSEAPLPSTRLPFDFYGKRVLLLRDQGVGDELFFLRFAARVRTAGGWIGYQPSPKLATLLQRCDALDAVVPDNALPPDIDHVLAVPDLPLATHMRCSEDIPPPLRLPPLSARVAALRARLEQLGRGPYLGLTWRAGPRIRVEERGLVKRIDGALLGTALGQWPGQLLALQRSPEAGEIGQLAHALGRPLHDFSALNDDLEDMLALLALLDEYVGVSNTNMHLRAAAGRPARVLVPHPPEWRWMTSGSRSPWFPEFTVYRESRQSGWTAALAALARDLSTGIPVTMEHPSRPAPAGGRLASPAFPAPRIARASDRDWAGRE